MITTTTIIMTTIRINHSDFDSEEVVVVGGAFDKGAEGGI